MSNLNLKAVLELVDKITRPLKSIQQQTQRNDNAMADLTHTIDRLNQTLSNGATRRYGQQMQENRRQISASQSALHVLAGGYDNVSRALDIVNRKTRQWSESIRANRQQINADIRKTAVSSLAIGYAASIPLRAFADAEDAAMTLKVSMMDGSGQVAKEFDSINALATKLGTKLPGTNAEFQLMMANLVQQGITFKSILGGTGEAAGNLAVLLKMPFEDAAVFAAKMQDATQTTEQDMLSLMDTIQRTSYLGVDPTNMLSGFAKISAGMKIIKQQGLDGAKAMAPLLVMADQSGMEDLSSAGNAYSKIFKAMLDQDTIDKALIGKKLKLDFSNGKGEFGSLDKMFKELEKFKNMTTQARLPILEDIFGNDAETIQALNLLIDKGQTGYDDTIKKMQRQADLQTRIEAQLGTLSNLWDQTKGAATNAMVSVVEALAPSIKIWVTQISALSERFNKWAKANPELIRTIAKLLLQLLAFKFAMLGIRSTGSLIFGTFFAMVAGITKFALIMYLVNRVATRFGFGFGTRLALMAKGVRLFASAFIFLAKNSIPMVIQSLISLSVALFTTPIGWIILAIGAAALLIIKYWQPIKAFFIGLWAGLVEGLAPLRQTFSTVFDSMRDSLAPLEPLWNVLGSALGFVIDLVKQLFSPFQATSSELNNATTYGHAFGLMLADVINVVGTLVAMLIHLASYVIGLVITGWQLIGETAAAMWISITEFFSSGIGNISATIANWSILGLFVQAFSAVMSWFGIELPSTFTEFGRMLMTGLANGITAGISWVVDKARAAASAVTNTAKSVLGIHSPSRVFNQLGHYTMQGLEQGLLSGAAMPIGAIGHTSQDMIKALDTSQIQIDRRPPLTSRLTQGPNSSAAAPVTIHMTINAAAGMNEQQLAQLVAAEVAKATRSASPSRAALYDME